MSEKERKKFVVFDFGSVLRVRTALRPQVDWELVALLNSKLDEVGFNPSVRVDSPESLKRFLRGDIWKDNVGLGYMTRQEAYNHAFNELSIEDEAFRKMFVYKLDFEAREVLKDMRSLLRKLKNLEEVELAILSNHSNELPEWLERYELVPEFFEPSMVIVSAEVGVKKPDPKIFEILLETLRQKDLKKSSDILFIDNREDNCEAAAQMGLRTHCFRYDADNHSQAFNALQHCVDSFLNNGFNKLLKSPKKNNINIKIL